MPRYIKCCNTWCNNSSDRDGQPCPTCKQLERKQPQTCIDQKAENRVEYDRRKADTTDHHRRSEE